MHKIPMEWAADALSALCDQIDGADKIDEMLIAAFQDAKLSFEDAVDRRIAFDRWVKIQVAAAEEGYRYYRARKEQLEALHTRFKEKTKEAMELQPGVEYRGKLGKMYLQNNPVSVEYQFGGKEVTPEVIEMFGVPEDYVTAKMTYAIDSARVKADLQSGKTFAWATLRNGKHVRFPAVRKPDAIQGVAE